MNIIISRPATLRIVRSLAAAQILSDRRGDGNENHPLAFLLDDPDDASPLIATLAATRLTSIHTILASSDTGLSGLVIQPDF